MNFNPDLNKQATELQFSCKKNSPNHPSLFFNESVVPKVKGQKHLGLTLDSKLSFERHVNEKIIKAKKGIGIIKYLSKFLPIKTLDQMYKALVRSHLDYCDTIYHIPALNSQINSGVTLNSLMEKVERTQYQAALAITGSWQGILQIHKIEKYKTPSYLKDKLPPHRRLLYRLNNSNTFQEIRCKTARYKNRFFPDTTSSWNNMISNFQEIPTFTSLKSHLLSLIRPKIKSTFGIHDALGFRFLL